MQIIQTFLREILMRLWPNHKNNTASSEFNLQGDGEDQIFL